MATVTFSSPFHSSTPSPPTPYSNLTPRQRIIETAEAMTTYFVPYHLRRTVEHHKLQGLPKHYLIPPQHPSPLYMFVADICTQLGEENAEFFNTIGDNMNVRQNNAKDVYISVCRTVFQDGVVNWGRVMSLLTLAATFAVHLAKRGELSTVTKIPQWLREVVETELVDWIAQKGGWEDVQRSLSNRREPSRWSRVIAYGAVMATAGFLLFSMGKGKFL